MMGIGTYDRPARHTPSSIGADSFTAANPRPPHPASRSDAQRGGATGSGTGAAVRPAASRTGARA